MSNLSTSNPSNPSTDETNEIEKWQFKHTISWLKNAKGDGTSFISLICNPTSKIDDINKLLIHEYGTATNIKSRVNRQAVEDAIVSCQQKLKLYNKIPKNGLAIYAGLVDGKRICLDIHPLKPIKDKLYLCDNQFHVESIEATLMDSNKYGFIIVDGKGVLFAVLNDKMYDILESVSVDLPKKHNKGGQSSLRFARIRTEKRHNYITKVTELAKKNFITDNKLNVDGIILAGNAEFKDVLVESKLFDQKLSDKIIGIYDISYGQECGLKEAIRLSKDKLSGLSFIRESEDLMKYFDEIKRNTGKYTYGIKETIKAFEEGLCETLFIDENTKFNRIVKNDIVSYSDEEDGENLLEWLINTKTNNTSLKIISSNTTEGTQFIQGFGGIGSILRYAVVIEDDVEELDEDYSDFL